MSWVLTVVLEGRDDDREYLFDERPEIRSEYGLRTVEYSGEYEGRRLEVLVTVENAATVMLERVGEAEELEKAQGEGPALGFAESTDFALDRRKRMILYDESAVEDAKRLLAETEAGAGEPDPEIGLSWGASSLVDAMEEAVEAKERAEEERAHRDRVAALVGVADAADIVYRGCWPFVLNADVYIVGVASMEDLGDALETWRDLVEEGARGNA